MTTKCFNEVTYGSKTSAKRACLNYTKDHDGFCEWKGRSTGYCTTVVDPYPESKIACINEVRFYVKRVPLTFQVHVQNLVNEKIEYKIESFRDGVSIGMMALGHKLNARESEWYSDAFGVVPKTELKIRLFAIKKADKSFWGLDAFPFVQDFIVKNKDFISDEEPPPVVPPTPDPTPSPDDPPYDPTPAYECRKDSDCSEGYECNVLGECVKEDEPIFQCRELGEKCNIRNWCCGDLDCEDGVCIDPYDEENKLTIKEVPKFCLVDQPVKIRGTTPKSNQRVWIEQTEEWMGFDILKADKKLGSTVSDSERKYEIEIKLECSNKNINFNPTTIKLKREALDKAFFIKQIDIYSERPGEKVKRRGRR